MARRQRGNNNQVRVKWELYEYSSLEVATPGNNEEAVYVWFLILIPLDAINNKQNRLSSFHLSNFMVLRNLDGQHKQSRGTGN